MTRRRSRRRRRSLRRFALLGLAAGAFAYRKRRLAENERAVWPSGPPGRPPPPGRGGDGRE